MLGRILAVNSVERAGARSANRKRSLERPFLSANDRSRWATVRSLVEYGTFAIDDVVSQPGWDTIDMVKHVGSDGQEHLYSSKPPLMAVLLAGPYWVIHRLTGATLAEFPYEIGRAHARGHQCRWPHPLLRRAGAAGGSFRRDRLGAHLRDGRGHVWYLLDDL